MKEKCIYSPTLSKGLLVNCNKRLSSTKPTLHNVWQSVLWLYFNAIYSICTFWTLKWFVVGKKEHSIFDVNSTKYNCSHSVTKKMAVIKAIS